MPFNSFANRADSDQAALTADTDQAALLRSTWSGSALFAYGNYLSYDIRNILKIALLV